MTCSISDCLDPSPRGVFLVGDYGSGKTEVAVNLALRLAAEWRGRGRALAIADLDLVNPYFRCREAEEPLVRAGVRVVMPRQGHQFADLPILLPEVRGLLQEGNTGNGQHGPAPFAVLDVGGDAVGARVLAALAPDIRTREGGHALWFVANANRPFCDTAQGCLGTIRGIERSCGLQVTGLVSNTHLMEETTAEMVLQGLELAVAVARELGVEVRLVSLMAAVARTLAPGAVPYPLLVMHRQMVPPWIRRDSESTGPGLFKLGST